MTFAGLAHRDALPRDLLTLPPGTRRRHSVTRLLPINALLTVRGTCATSKRDYRYWHIFTARAIIRNAAWRLLPRASRAFLYKRRDGRPRKQLARRLLYLCRLISSLRTTLAHTRNHCVGATRISTLPRFAHMLTRLASPLALCRYSLPTCYYNVEGHILRVSANIILRRVHSCWRNNTRRHHCLCAPFDAHDQHTSPCVALALASSSSSISADAP